MRGLVFLALAACYSPSIAPGSPCDSDHACPNPLVCSPATQRCEETATPGTGDASLTGTDGAGFQDAITCYGHGLFNQCFPSGLTGSLMFGSSTTINTDTDIRCQPQAGACVMAWSAISIPAGVTVTVTGSSPLVFIAATTLDIAGVLDGASHRSPAQVGPGSNPSDCPVIGIMSGWMGGAGGSSSGTGGKGGDWSSTPGHAGAAPISPTTVRGGCSGQTGSSSTASEVGAGGAGGGALYLIAGVQITVEGTVNASGEGGGGGTGIGGGGGGGAGGMIGFDAPQVTLASTANVFANGGGGGAGGQFGGAVPGSDPAMPATAAAGGYDGTSGGNGGAGSSPVDLDGGAGTAAGLGIGGGGGGGAAGSIYVFPTQTLGGNVSPPPTM